MIRTNLQSRPSSPLVMNVWPSGNHRMVETSSVCCRTSRRSSQVWRSESNQIKRVRQRTVALQNQQKDPSSRKGEKRGIGRTVVSHIDIFSSALVTRISPSGDQQRLPIGSSWAVNLVRTSTSLSPVVSSLA